MGSEPGAHAVTPSPRPNQSTPTPRRKSLAEHAQECDANQRRLKQEAAARREATAKRRAAATR
jgi:hypothetical protein